LRITKRRAAWTAGTRKITAAADGAEFFHALTLRPEAVPEFVGDVFDLARERPEHLRMMTWAHLEALPLDEPQSSGHDIPGRDLRAIETARAAGYVDAGWQPMELLVMLFGIGMAWAHWPRQDDLSDDTASVAARRAAAVEAAERIVTPRGGVPSRGCQGRFSA
jgi:Tetracyclin repressor-like, C-terminal domain